MYHKHSAFVPVLGVASLLATATAQASDDGAGEPADANPGQSAHASIQPGDGAATSDANSSDATALPEGGRDSHAELAVKLQNPVANLISLPLQFNYDTGIGPDDDKDRIVLNVQPVIPFELNEDWNLISRTIIPVVYAEGPAQGISSEFGLGDVVQSLFFSPVDPVGGWILGAGPVAGIPTGTDDLFRSKQLSLGPTFVGLKQDKLGDGTLTYGMLANHLWKVAGSDDNPDTSATFLQPFVGYTTSGGSSFFLNTETTYDWTREDWSVPINASFSQLLHFGQQPVQLQFGGRYYVDTFDNGPEWGLRFSITFLFPK